MILDETIPRTLETLVSQLTRPAYRGARVEAWLFEDEAARRACEDRLAAAGVEARLRSAYKPLLHFFLEEVDLAALSGVTIRYPRHPNAPGRRFLLEAYPLAALLKDAETVFETSDQDGLEYFLTLVRKDGAVEEHRIFAPNRLHVDPLGQTLLSPTGWLKITGGKDGSDTDCRLATDYESAFELVITAVGTHSWPAHEPYFEELRIRIDLPGQERPLDCGDEAVSLHEALHEDVCFSLLQILQHHAGRTAGDRTFQPGQIVPDVRAYGDTLRVRVSVEPLTTGEAVVPRQPLATASAPLGIAQIQYELAARGGTGFEARSRAGRAVQGVYRRGTEAAVLISAGQHGNETSGVVGALRAADALAARPGTHFAVIPLENPDGYALHQRLSAHQPRHMLHAARYTAFGDDIEYRVSEPLHELAARREALRLTDAKLYINLHGYPSHEWTRPLSGYIPRNFETWTIPKGFFLIMRHHEGWREPALKLVDAVTARLAALPGLMDYNRQQLFLFETHAGETGYTMVNGFPCLIGEEDRHAVPMTLITEFPDETIYGEAFVFAHTAQMEAVLAAYEAYNTLQVSASDKPPRSY
ncbi:peptidase M14 [Chelativorans salis]|uniref:Peptidase M14 n=1 Tax=Chelativorans salis TaxID=2978478 RepID=A0ABT2LUQ6_9HYPH|nr:peptidase M14 [Chelativorans sp. EGI FJ00035]MCT7377819.1 peptidase M14 [Chelativorans sp. EGI FJ00035]